MPNVIISPGFASIRARAKEAQYDAIAQGFQTGANIIAQSMLDYKAKAQQEENIKLRMVDSMVQTYGEQADQPLLESYDKLLRKHGLNLPKDSAGRFLPPPPQSEFQMLRSQLAKGDPDGHLMANWMEKKLTGKSLIEQAFKTRDQEETTRYHNLVGDASNLRAQASMLRAQIAAAGSGPGSSGYIRLVNGEVIPDQGQDVPAGARRLSAVELRSDNSVVLRNSMVHLRALEEQIKLIDMDRKKHQVEMDIMFGKFQKVLPYIDKQAKGVFDNDPRMQAWIEQQKKDALDEAGIKEPEAQKSFLGSLGSLVQDWLRMPEDARSHILSGITVDPNEPMAENQGGPSPALTPPPSAKTKSLGIPGVEYLGPGE